MKKVYIVHAYYNMNINQDEEILIEPYSSLEKAQKRVKELIKDFKENLQQSYSDCWDEDGNHLYAYMDSEWNVDIGVKEYELK